MQKSKERRYPIPPEIIAYAATVSRNERINEMDEYDPQTLKISRYPIPPEIIAYAATVSRNERINEMDEYDPQTLKISRYPIPPEIIAYAATVSRNERINEMDKYDPQTLKISMVLKDGVSRENYLKFFHYVLWLEERHKSQQLKQTKLCGVKIDEIDNGYVLFIDEDKQENLNLRAGNLILLRARETYDKNFTARITDIKGAKLILKSKGLSKYDLRETRFDVKFMFSRKLFEMMHVAIDEAYKLKTPLIFPKTNDRVQSCRITRFFNPRVVENLEQRTAVECIVSGTSGNAPFLLLGPPGTGKTVTIVEAILQLVAANKENRILVCAHSNQAVDNVACVLQKYKKHFDENSDKLFLRINSRSRNCVQKCLEKDSVNAPVSMMVIKDYNIILCTLCHAYSYILDYITHVVIDEAAQANEPSCLIPASRMRSLRPLILAGDSKQLGPVVVSNESKKFGLGLSMMERLKETYPFYDNKAENKYMVMLKNNYRSDPHIIDLPNNIFYGGHLRAMAVVDPLSRQNILNQKEKCRAIVFHGVSSTETKDGTSFYNKDEIRVVQSYICKLVNTHNVKGEDIGIIATYKSQVTLIKKWVDLYQLRIDVATVDAFQGQEKRVILISTVRGKGANSNASLGFVDDDKRFNVALTRAKAKAIVIGNPNSLSTCPVWNMYIQKCQRLGTHYGHVAENPKSQTTDLMIEQLQIRNEAADSFFSQLNSYCIII